MRQRERRTGARPPAEIGVAPVDGGVAEPSRGPRSLQRCADLEPAVASARVLEVKVGLRPGRPSIRLEAERRASRTIVHNYGHGGAGMTVSWGCAEAVVELCKRTMQSRA